LTDVIAEHHYLDVELPEQGHVPQLTGLLSMEGVGRTRRLLCRGNLNQLKQGLQAQSLRLIQRHGASLDDIFVASSAFKNQVKEAAA